MARDFDTLAIDPVLTALTLGTFALQAWLAAILFHKKLARRFPFFAVYTVYSVAVTPMRIAFSFGDGVRYAIMYWLTEIPYALLGLAAICEGFNRAIQPFDVVRWLRRALPVTAAIMILMVVLHVMGHRAAEQHRAWEAILAASIAVRNIQVGIFIVFVLLMLLFHIPYRKYSVTVVNGFGFAAVGMLLGSLVRFSYGTRLTFLFQYAPTIAYVVAMIFWLRGFHREEQTESPYGTPSQELVSEMEQYEDLLRRHLK